jgi:Flp pilus assembly pilin Flp
MKNQQGQALVEYILLIVVAASIIITLFNSRAFKRLFGEDGALGTKIKDQNEFSYRHAFYSSDYAKNSRIGEKQISTHPSYKGDKGEETRFFGPKDPYGEK